MFLVKYVLKIGKRMCFQVITLKPMKYLIHFQFTYSIFRYVSDKLGIKICYVLVVFCFCFLGAAP